MLNALVSNGMSSKLVVGTLNALVSNGMSAKLVVVRLKSLMSNGMAESCRWDIMLLVVGHNVMGR